MEFLPNIFENELDLIVYEEIKYLEQLSISTFESDSLSSRFHLNLKVYT